MFLLITSFLYILQCAVAQLSGANWRKILLIISGLMAAVYSCFYAKDSPIYHNAYQMYGATDFSNFAVERINMEPLFLVVSKINHAIGLPVFFVFLIFAFISVSTKISLISKVSISPKISFGLFFCYFFILHDSTQIRASIGIAVAYYAIYLLSQNKKFIFIFVIIFSGVFVHSSSFIALLLLPYNLLGRRINNFDLKVLILSLFIGAITATVSLVSLANFKIAALLIITNKLAIYGENAEELTRVGPFSTFHIMSFLFTSFFLFVSKSFGRAEFLFFRCLCIANLAFVVFPDFKVIQFRLVEFLLFSTVFLVPRGLNFVSEKTNLSFGKVIAPIYFSLCLVIFVFYTGVYQMLQYRSFDWNG
ncbi:EpsG family protein [Robbsia sp. KACC 23696]|uniref:EpsG family protein n=1 Tax=Robbsia sp. KACC 23696 TaxID=3149231 RepID=UPI00325B9B40